MKLRRGLAYGSLVVAASLWVGLVFLAPWARGRGLALGEWIYLFFAPVCHQMPERSFALWGSPLAVCHRCLGLYSGFWLGLLALPPALRLRGDWRPYRRLVENPRWILAFAAPMLVDALLLPNTPATRFGSGLLAAFPLAWLLWAAAEQLLTRESVPIVCNQGGNPT